MAIAFPALPFDAQVGLRFVRYGGPLRSALGGPTLNLRRLGLRYQATCQLPPLDAPCARAWVAAQAESEASGEPLRLFVPQLGVGAAGVTGSGSVNSTAITASGGEVGQHFSFEAGDVSYLHTLTGASAVSPPLRAACSGALEFEAPVIEGFLDDPAGFDVELMRFVGLSFSITEAR